MAQQTPLHFVFYFAAPPDKVWEGTIVPTVPARMVGHVSSLASRHLSKLAKHLSHTDARLIA
jgi:hypothetical protein